MPTRRREDHAHRVSEDMKGESAECLDGIRCQMEAEFWEVSDRGIDFEHLPDDRRGQLSVFFGGFSAG